MEAVSLNFKDVMLLQGLLDASAFDGGWSMDAIGLDCTDIVVEVGGEVPKGINVGDCVMASPAKRRGAFQKCIESPHYVVTKVCLQQ